MSIVPSAAAGQNVKPGLGLGWQYFGKKDSTDALMYRDFCTLKLGAMKAQKYTDCSFLVGEDGGEMKTFHGIKADLMIVSGFMEGMFNSELCPEFPVRITNIKPKPFALIMEFVHAGRIVSDCNCREAVELAIAADHLLIDSLKPVCIELVQSKVTVGKVWVVLDSFFKFGLTHMASSCHKLLATETETCLKVKPFLTASKESVIELLTMDKKLAIKSEKMLIDSCYKWAQNSGDARESMRFLLPYFHLLALQAKEATELSHFLTFEEEAKLLRFYITKKLDGIPETWNTCVVSRYTAEIEQQLLSSEDLCRLIASTTVAAADKNSLLCIKSSRYMWITKLKCLKGSENNIPIVTVCVHHPGYLQQREQKVETIVSSEMSTTFELTMVNPICILSNNIEMRITLSANEGLYPQVPCSTPNNTVRPIRRHITQLDHTYGSVITLLSFTYVLEEPN